MSSPMVVGGNVSPPKDTSKDIPILKLRSIIDSPLPL